MGVVLLIIAGLWGFAEATLFFIVPDVAITFAAIWRMDYGIYASAAAFAGAWPGGLLMYKWGRRNFQAAQRAVGQVPAVSHSMMSGVSKDLQQKGLWAMSGVLRGIPYKIYAIYSSQTKVSLGAFLLASIPARILRFLVAALTAAVLSDIVFPFVPNWVQFIGWALVWGIIYGLYFRHFGKKS